MEDGKKPHKRADYSNLLRVDGKQFRSVAAFCEEYDLGYRTALSFLKKGCSGEEIVHRMLELPDIPKKNRNSRPVIYAGTEYPSVAEACRELQLQRGRVYNFLRRGVSAEEALELAAKAQKVYDSKTDGRSASSGPAGDPCTIDGVYFPTRKAACDAFQVSYPSVMSRIQRHPKMPFEEALLRGARKWKYVKPMRQMSDPAGDFYHVYQFSSGNGDELDLPLLLQIEESLAANDCSNPEEIVYEWDRDPERWILEFDIYLHPPRTRKCVSILYKKSPPAFVQSVQFFLSGFYMMPGDAASREANAGRCMELINQLHIEFAGVTLSFLDGIVRASGLYTTSGQSFSGRQFMYALHRFLGTAAAMHSRFQEKFGSEG